MKTILSISFFVVCYLALVNTRPQHGKNNNEIKGFKGIKMNKPNHLAMTKATLPKGLPRNIDIDNYGTSAAADADMYQGDIKLTATQMKNMKNQGRALVGAITSTRWPSGVIPYTFVNHTSSEQTLILAAMQLVTTKTSGCISFRPKIASDPTYLSIFNSNGCWSYVGKVFTGAQPLSLQNNAAGSCLGKGTTVHELLHAAGLYHEQSRQDRDSFVTVNYQNMASSSYSQFDKQSGNYYSTNYDYYSIMHYAANDFSVNGQPTIVPKDPSVVLLSSYAKTDSQIMTNSDILAVERFYQCPETVSIGTTTTTSTTTASTTKASNTTATTTKATTTTATTTKASAGTPTSFKLTNNISGYNIYIYVLQGSTLTYKYTIRSGLIGPLTSTTSGVQWYAFTSDFVYVSYWTAGQGLFSTNGANVKLGSLQWYLY